MNVASTGEIRTIWIDNSTMGRIHLKLGQSTVLRFREKPKKVVVGNQNYFAIEFIDNDLTVQPQENVTSNLFVYGEYHTYGLILHTTNHYGYDDLVNVRWKNKYRKIILREPTRKIEKKREVDLFLLEVKSCFSDNRKGVSVADIIVTNNSSNEIAIDAVKIDLLRDGKKVNATVVFNVEEIEKDKKEVVRIIFGQGKGKVSALFMVNGSKKEIALRMNTHKK